MFTFLTILTVIFVILFIVGFFVDDDGSVVMNSILFLIGIGLFGWLIAGHTFPVKSEYFELKKF